jgi:phosphate:Na+ symporter
MIKEILLFSAGIILFLFGMMKLSSAVQQLFTVRIREYIRYAVTKPVYGLVVGIAATVLFQSSSATTFLTVGMVSAGLITFYHSLGIILGADIGTTLTVQLVVWKFTDVSPLFIIIGGVIWLSGNASRRRSIGEAIFYFGLIFFGLSLANLATAPLKDYPPVLRFFEAAGQPLIGLAVGILFTGLVHASAIPIGILVIMAQNQLITLEAALPIVFGANVGTTVTALMAGAVADISGRRTAVAHLLFKCCGALICLIGLPWIVAGLREMSGDTAQHIALGHLLLNLLIVVVFLPMLKPVSRLIEKMLPGRADVLPLWPEFLNEKALDYPDQALACVRKELRREIALTEKMYADGISLVEDFKEGKRRNILYVEPVVDNLRREIVRYLWKLSCRELSPERSRRLFAYAAMVDDIERLGDHVVTIAGLCRVKARRRIAFSRFAYEELRVIEGLIGENLRDAAALIEGRDLKRIETVGRREEEIDVKVREARERHLVRFHQRVCPAEAGPVYVEMLIHLERISDHCQNIADAVADIED